MKRFLIAVLGVALAGLMAAPSWAYSPDPEVTININGVEFEGLWAMVGERPYVGVSSFAKALGFPRVHNTKAWFIGEGEPKTMNPLDLVVYSPEGKLPTTRFGGATMVDLRSAAEALDMPFHYDFYSRTYQLGSPYKGEWLPGAYYRFFAVKDWADWGIKSVFNHPSNLPYSQGADWPEGRTIDYTPYPDDYHNVK